MFPIPLPLDGVLLIGLEYIGPPPYHITIRGEPIYIGLGKRKCGPVRPHLVVVPLQLLTQIVFILADT